MEFEEFSEALATFIQKRRKSAGLSQKELAAMTGLSQPSIAAIERAEAVRLKTLFKVFKALNLNKELELMMSRMESESESVTGALAEKLVRARKGHLQLTSADFERIIAQMPNEVLPVTKTVGPKLRAQGYCIRFDEEINSFVATTKERALELFEKGEKGADLFVCGMAAVPVNEL